MQGMPIPRQDSTAQAKTGLDINQVGTYDGVEIFDVDLDAFEDRPWRKPGADLTDYFNFGFNEQTWKAYCMKQKMIRDEIMHQQRYAGLM
jgi:pre-mRNA 3'-end-processing factor FIP1